MIEANFLSYSAGTGSSALLWMVLRGEIPKPKHFYVLRADPGMEDFRSYDYAEKMERLCSENGIEVIQAKGGNLFLDLTDKSRWVGEKRMDLPPFWTINRETGKKGRLKQGCTQKYKIQPMDQEMRRIIYRDFGIAPDNKMIGRKLIAKKWIGFSHCEWHRCSDSDRKFIQFRYPLIELKMDKPAISQWYRNSGLQEPPRSVCVGCYANDVEYFRDMHRDRPSDFEMACLVDDNIRDLRQFGVKDICYVSSTCIPLRELAANGFRATDQENIAGCHSGYCFV